MTEPNHLAETLTRVELEAAALRYAQTCSSELLPSTEVHAALLDAAVAYCVTCGHPSQ
jgi:hypothetical protein